MKPAGILSFALFISLVTHPAASQTLSNCNLTGSNVQIRDSMHLECAPLMLNSTTSISIQNQAVLEVDGSVEVYGNANLDLKAGSKMVVYGDLKVSGNGSVKMNGHLEVYGNVLVSGQASVCGGGDAVISGLISGAGWCLDINSKPADPIEVDAILGEDSSVRINWKSSLELPGEFIVERSVNGMSFANLKETKVATDGLGTFTDVGLKPGTYYYRIRQTNGDELQYAHKEIALTVRSGEDGACEIIVDPNPCVPSCNVILSDCPGSAFRTYLLDGAGRKVSELVPISENKGDVQYHLSKDNFMMPGVYIIRTTSDSASATKKVMVK